MLRLSVKQFKSGSTHRRSEGTDSSWATDSQDTPDRRTAPSAVAASGAPQWTGSASSFRVCVCRHILTPLETLAQEKQRLV